MVPLSKEQIINEFFDNKELDLIEGIWLWDNNLYEVAIVKNDFEIFPNYEYLGILTDTRNEKWSIGEVKFALKKIYNG